MATERKWDAVPPRAFIASGTAQGVITLADTAGFKTKQVAYLSSSTIPAPLAVQVKRVLSPTKLIVGAVDNKIASWKPLDISAYTVVTGAVIGAEEQNKNNVPTDDHYSAVYESDPTVADRVVFVDKYGNFYDDTNPLPIIFDGTVTIGTIQIEGPSGNILDPASDGSVKTIQLFTKPFDSITATYPTSTQEIYKSRVGGILGVVQETVTLNYTDPSKRFILNVART